MRLFFTAAIVFNFTSCTNSTIDPSFPIDSSLTVKEQEIKYPIAFLEIIPVEKGRKAFGGDWILAGYIKNMGSIPYKNIEITLSFFNIAGESISMLKEVVDVNISPGDTVHYNIRKRGPTGAEQVSATITSAVPFVIQ
ncbi:MAG: hypothetical protein H0W50_09660 [Parachlamydiaceae bacterium]|nr:hypothetical protein [Parachlamydiaceae bacterium]